MRLNGKDSFVFLSLPLLQHTNTPLTGPEVRGPQTPPPLNSGILAPRPFVPQPRSPSPQPPTSSESGFLAPINLLSQTQKSGPPSPLFSQGSKHLNPEVATRSQLDFTSSLPKQKSSPKLSLSDPPSRCPAPGPAPPPVPPTFPKQSSRATFSLAPPLPPEAPQPQAGR